jgi:predicted RNase H-like nuclease
MTAVIGVDAAARGWLAIVLRDGVVAGSRWARTVRELLDAYPDVTTIGIDIPIGLPRAMVRPADAAAKRFVGAKMAASVFPVPPESVLRAALHADAVAIARRDLGHGISRQSHGLAGRIFEVAEIAAQDPRLFEVHPEVSFAALAERPLRYSKHTWAGLIERLDLLRDAGIHMPMEIDGGARVAPDDAVDAAVAAWSALRIAEGRSATVPAVMPGDPAQGGVIHY